MPPAGTLDACAECVDKGSWMKRNFSFSSPQRRGPSDPWFRIGTIDVTTTVFVVGLGVLSMFVYAAQSSLFNGLLLDTEGVRQGQLWRLLTWPAANAPSISAAITIAVFWYFGRNLEEMFGRVRFAKFLVILAVVPAAILALVSFAIPSLRTGAIGLSLIELGVFAAFVAEQPFARFFFGLQGWMIAAVIVGIRVLELLSRRDWGGLLLLLLILAAALLLSRAYGFAAEQLWIPKIALPTGSRSGRSKGKGPKVVSGPWKGAGVEVSNAANDMVAQAQMDRLLDKIARSGMDSLSADEKRQLKAHSKRLRGDG
jgi:membrane associated rhomboid family serine protease